MGREDWLIERLQEIGERFAGVDIQFRRVRGDGWDDHWRVSVKASKNERAGFRITRYGATFDDAASAVIEAVDDESNSHRTLSKRLVYVTAIAHNLAGSR